MDLVIGRPNSLATNKPLPPSNGQDMASVSSLAMDNRYQRLFVTDSIRVSRHEARNRILVYDVDPEQLTDYPEAIAVLGQPDFATNEPGLDAASLGGGSRVAMNEEDSWLFAVDGTNNRVLVFDVSPDRLESGMEAIAVIGQPDFESNTPGIGTAGLTRPAFVAYDPVYRRLFVTDAGNQRIVMYDIPRFEIGNGLEASVVMGQDDFNSSAPRTDTRKAAPSDLAIDPATQRLFISEVGNNRILAFDIHPDRLVNNPDAINVIGQPDFDYTDFDPSVSRNTTRSPHQLAIDPENQLAYMVDGFTGRNAVTIFDIHPDRLENQPDALDVLGQLDDAGEPGFERRAPQDVINGRFGAEIRSLALDPVDHRLIAGDQYNHRVIIWQLDEDNRFQDRTADWVIGQPDLDSSYLRQRSAQNLKKPYALAYDHRHKRLFIAETLSDRITVWNLDPEQMTNYPEAIGVIGQPDFTTRLPQRTRQGLFLGDSMNHGIGSGGTRPTGLAMDVENQRLFISDASNHRVMVFDVDPERFENYPEAIAVLGQPDFTSGIGPAPGALSVDSTALTAAAQSSRAAQSSVEPARDSLFWPAALDFDSKSMRLFVNDGFNHRVMVFDVAPQSLENGADAIAVIGQSDFESNSPGMTRSKFQWPDGVAFDVVKNLLYVTDMGNDRILVFDVNPDSLENGPEAVAVIGQTGFESWHVGPEQDRLSDPRDVEFDSENQRLFVADSYQTRVLAYDMPSDSRPLDIGGFGSERYSTLDWKMAPRTQHYATLAGDSGNRLETASILSFSETVMDPVTLRESRVLQSELALPATDSQRQAWLYAGTGQETQIVVQNPGDSTVELAITLRAPTGAIFADGISYRVEAGQQLILEASSLDARFRQEGALIQLSGNAEFIVQAFSFDNSTGKSVAFPTAVIRAPADSNFANIPNLRFGGGYRSSVLLINPTGDTLSGQIAVHGLRGEDQVMGYSIAPGAMYQWQSGSQPGLERSGYITVHGENQTVPIGGAHVSLFDADELMTRRYVPTRQTSNRVWIPADNMPSTTRHGRINVTLRIVNSGAVPAAGANVRINLFAPDGSFVERFEQIIPIGEQWDIPLVELAKSNQFRGSIRIASDVPVVFSATQRTENINGDYIEMELPVFDEQDSAVPRPLLLDGEGVASEIILVNPTDSLIESELDFFTEDGDTASLILR